MDFMDADSAMLVGWRLVPAQSERGTYSVRGAAWAEPDTAEAALALRALADDPALRRRLAAAGLARMADFTPAACGARALALLASGGADAGLPSAVAMA
jgi:glycosyltransferase involved in cell wall biosynthesis